MLNRVSVDSVDDFNKLVDDFNKLSENQKLIYISSNENTNKFNDYEKKIIEGTKSIISVLEKLEFPDYTPVLISAIGTILYNISDMKVRNQTSKDMLEQMLFTIEKINNEQ